MRLFRFDEEVSIPASNPGSRLRVGPLTARSDGIRVQVLHIPPDGLVGRHATSSRQLIAVIVGSGWVSGHDAERRAAGSGHAALWERGEEQEVYSEEGLTAVLIEGDLEVEAMAVTQDIVVSDYDPSWRDWWHTLHRHVWPAVQDVALRIDHVGSTAVPGLAAKPIIDMDIVVASEDDVRPVIDRLATIGYRWRGDLGVVGREAFRAAAGTGLPEHHLYLVVEDNRAHLDHVLLRDLLQEDPEARERYAALKKRNAQLANRDIDVYLAAKAELVAELLTRARAERGLPPVTYWAPDVALP